MSSFFTALGGFSRTFGTTMNGEVQKVLFLAKARKYPLAARVGARRRRTSRSSVYTRLIDGVNRNLPAFHRYLKLRKRMMGLDQLHYYDLYAPLVGSVNSKYTPEEAQKHVLAAVAPLGADYQATIQRGVQRAVDRSVAERGQALGRLLQRRRVRRPPLHADQLQRQIHRRQHAGARARPHDAELLLEQDAAVPARRLPDLRRRGGVHLQRVAAHRPHAEERSKTTTRGCRCSATTSRTSRAPCSARRSSPNSSCGMHEMAQKGQPITGDALAKLYLDITKQLLRPRPGRVHRRRLHPPTSGATSRISTATSTSSSTPRRSRHPRRWPQKVKAGDAGGDEDAISRS